MKAGRGSWLTLTIPLVGLSLAFRGVEGVLSMRLKMFGGELMWIRRWVTRVHMIKE